MAEGSKLVAPNAVATAQLGARRVGRACCAVQGCVVAVVVVVVAAVVASVARLRLRLPAVID